MMNLEVGNYRIYTSKKRIGINNSKRLEYSFPNNDNIPTLIITKLKTLYRGEHHPGLHPELLRPGVVPELDLQNIPFRRSSGRAVGKYCETTENRPKFQIITPNVDSGFAFL